MLTRTTQVVRAMWTKSSGSAGRRAVQWSMAQNGAKRRHSLVGIGFLSLNFLSIARSVYATLPVRYSRLQDWVGTGVVARYYPSTTPEAP